VSTVKTRGRSPQGAVRLTISWVRHGAVLWCSQVRDCPVPAGLLKDTIAIQHDLSPRRIVTSQGGSFMPSHSARDGQQCLALMGRGRFRASACRHAPKPVQEIRHRIEGQDEVAVACSTAGRTTRRPVSRRCRRPPSPRTAREISKTQLYRSVRTKTCGYLI
jgi:hypothetical protein